MSPATEVRWVDGATRDFPETVDKWVQHGGSEVYPGALYYLWDLSGELVYVGETINPTRRFQTHAGKPWWSEIARAEVIWYPNQLDARRAEAREILTRGPLRYCRQKPMGRYYEDDEAAYARWLKRWRAERASGGVRLDPAKSYEEARTHLEGTGLTVDDLIGMFLRWFNADPSEAFRRMTPSVKRRAVHNDGTAPTSED